MDCDQVLAAEPRSHSAPPQRGWPEVSARAMMVFMAETVKQNQVCPLLFSDFLFSGLEGGSVAILVHGIAET